MVELNDTSIVSNNEKIKTTMKRNAYKIKPADDIDNNDECNFTTTTTTLREDHNYYRGLKYEYRPKSNNNCKFVVLLSMCMYETMRTNHNNIVVVLHFCSTYMWRIFDSLYYVILRFFFGRV